MKSSRGAGMAFIRRPSPFFLFPIGYTFARSTGYLFLKETLCFAHIIPEGGAPPREMLSGNSRRPTGLLRTDRDGWIRIWE